MALSRRSLFGSFLDRTREAVKEASQPSSDAPSSPPPSAPATESPATPAPPTETPASEEEPAQLALILDRFCLAYQGSFCSVCSERCPEPGAILTSNGRPHVVPDACTGCAICHDVCPAPKNAVFLVARKPKQGMIGKTVDETRPEEEDDL